jgi:hypothetical protein
MNKETIWTSDNLVKVKLTKTYHFSQKELKNKLKLEGDIVNIGLWEGLSPKEESENVKKDRIIYEITTEELKE